MSRDRARSRFVAALLKGGVARRIESGAWQVSGGALVRLDAVGVRSLIADGVLEQHGGVPFAGDAARNWLRRMLLQPDGAMAGQHRTMVQSAEGLAINLDESPLGRLARAEGDSAPFLSPHQVAAGEKLRWLVERGQMRQRVTLSYDPGRSGNRSAGTPAPDIAEGAMDARRKLGQVLERLPDDCAGVVMDVCGLLKGLQQVESERGWPRRSAKLVLRIGLEQVATELGMVPQAGRGAGIQGWMGEGARAVGV